MEPEKINVNYSGSYVMTLRFVAYLILILGIVSAVIFIMLEGFESGLLIALPMALSALFLFLMLMAAHSALKMLLHIKSYYVHKAKADGCEFKETGFSGE